MEDDVRIAQTVLDLLRAILRIEDAMFMSTEEVQTDGWLLEGDKINNTGLSLIGDPREVIRHQMSLDAAVFAMRAMQEAGSSASLQLIENASLLEQS